VGQAHPGKEITMSQNSRTTRWIPVALLTGAVLALPIYAAADASASAAAPPAACVRFVTPGTASAGEQIPLLAYRPRTHQGPLEIRFDGQTVEHQLTRYAGFTVPNVTELFLTVRVPSWAASGRHQLQLHVPSTGPEPLAVSTIILGP
jgi:hypothetical protein